MLNTGTPTKARHNGLAMALGSGATTFYAIPSVYPANVFATNAFSNSASGRRGLRFKVPFKCRCAGMKIFAQFTTGGTFNLTLYDDAGSELNSSSTAFDNDLQVGAAIDFGADYTLKSFAYIASEMDDYTVATKPGTYNADSYLNIWGATINMAAFNGNAGAQAQLAKVNTFISTVNDRNWTTWRLRA